MRGEVRRRETARLGPWRTCSRHMQHVTCGLRVPHRQDPPVSQRLGTKRDEERKERKEQDENQLEPQMRRRKGRTQIRQEGERQEAKGET